MYFHKNIRKMNKGLFPEIRLDKCLIEAVDTFRYLGIIVDLKLKLTGQLSKNLQNANHKLYLFKNN